VTDDAKFKNAVRARMAETGEKYTQARGRDVIVARCHATTAQLRGRGQAASIVANGPRYHRVVTASHASLTGLRPGVYVLTLRPVVIRRTSARVVAGAVAYPSKGRLTV
jgi:hypothetical protein